MAARCYYNLVPSDFPARAQHEKAMTPIHSSPLFVLVTTDVDGFSGRLIRAGDIAKHRLSARVWPLYERTPNRSAIAPGASLAVYIGGRGPGAGRIAATAIVSGKRENRRGSRIDPPDASSETPRTILDLSDIRVLSEPPLLRGLLEAAGRRVGNMGAVLRGGCRALHEPAVYAALFPDGD